MRRALLIAGLLALWAPAAYAQSDDDATDEPPAEATSDASDEAESPALPPPRRMVAEESPPPRTVPDERPAPRETTATTTTATTTTMDPPQPASTPYRRGREEEEPPPDGGDPYDFLWIEAFGGISYVDLRAFDQNNFYPEFVTLSGTGGMGGAALGFRIEFLSVGARVAIAHYGDEFDVGTAVGEVTLAIPIPIVRPYFRVGFGFGWHGDSNYPAPERSQTTVFGFAFNGTVGLDIVLVDWFWFGAAFSMDVLNMSRQSIDDPATAPTDVRFEDTGDAVGYQARGQAQISFHF